MSVTPRTDAEAFFPHDSKYRVCDADFARTLERELNAANQIIRQQQLLDEENLRLEEDSQRLNWLLNRGLAWRDCYNDCWIEGEWLYASQSALEIIDEAKEVNP